jgi:hypothetical protein
VTQVTKRTLTRLAFLTLLTGASLAESGLSVALQASGVQQPRVEQSTKPAEALYLRLRGVGLDPNLTFRVRGASIDRSALHITLEDGEISFTTGVDGHVTGAFFEGDGEVLLTPPNQVERASMTLFTGMAILEERFTSGYLRFNDETFAELRSYLRPADDAKEFSSRWNETAHNLAESDALRLLATFSHSLPTRVKTGNEPEGLLPKDHLPSDRLLHARLQGQKLGTFDVGFDSMAAEQVWAGQARTHEGVPYYDLWTSFAASEHGSSSGPQGLQQSADDLEIASYHIRTEVKPPTSLTADARLHVRVRRGGARTVFFELSRFLQVKRVTVNGEAVEFINNTAIDGTQLARRGNDLVAVVFPAQLQIGQDLILQFEYGGGVLSDAGGGLLYVGARGTWYPNRGLQMANFDLEFHYPATWTLVATGKQVATVAPAEENNSSLPQSAGEQVDHWVTERPSTLAGFNLGKYEKATAEAGNVTVSVYASKGVERTFPRASEEVMPTPDARLGRLRQAPIMHSNSNETPSPARNAQIVAGEGARAVEFFSTRFGSYPYGSLKFTQMPGQISQGWPGLVFLTSLSFLTPQQASDLHMNPTLEIFNRLVLPHETAHQWWGDLVGWRSYRDQWVVEALANYSALMMLESQNSQDARKVLEQYREDLLAKNKEGEPLRDAGPVNLGLRLNSSHFPNGYEAISYGRGTWLFHMLRHMLLGAESRAPSHSSGTEEPFIHGLHKLRDRYAGKEITTQELLSVFEEELPRPLWYEGRKSLDWFLESWIEGVALPHFSLENVKYATKQGELMVSGTIRQRDAPDSLVTAVPVYGSVAGKLTLLRIVFVDAPETPFHLTAPVGTKKLILDPYQTLLTSPK